MDEEYYDHAQGHEDKIGAPKILSIILSLLAALLCVGIVNSTPYPPDQSPWKDLDIDDIELLIIAVLGLTATVITTAGKLPRLRQILQGASIGIPTAYLLMFFSMMSFTALPLILLFLPAYALAEWDCDSKLGRFFLIGWSSALLINIYVLGIHKYFLAYFLD